MPDTPDFSVLEKQTDSIIEKLFVRSTLVQPGPAIFGHPALSTKFEQSVSLYRVGAFREAKVEFCALADLADSDRPNAGFTPRLNAAVCAAASKDWSVVLELLTPIFNTGHLYGHPLWNLALAYYHLNQISDALGALEVWVSKAFKGHARGLLLIAALALKNGDKIRGKAALQRAIEVDADFVAGQLQPHSLRISEKPTPLPVLRPQPPLDTAVRERLLALVQPKRPERRPELNLLLPGDAMEVFTSAIEEIAEGRFQQAKDHLAELRERLPHVQHLRFAVGACELFTGNNEKAKDILLPAIESGARILGSALWNLACAQIRLGDFSGARDALLKCSETEYKTKGQLWVALGVLTPGAKGATEEGTPRVIVAIAGTSSGPQSLAQRRRAQLERLIKPRKIPPSYKPDIAKLTIRDRQTVEQILWEAGQTDPSNALSMLVPWIARYPAIFTLKVRGAAFALFARDLSEAFRLLREASELRPLDAASRWNLAYVCLCKSDYLGIIRALEGGENYPMAEKSEYWLALAVARVTCGDGDPSAPAARSLALATSDVSRKIITSTLTDCEIVPASAVQAENPAITAAREAQRHLEQDNLAGALECLNQICGDQFERVGEIGDRVFDPQFVRLPDSKWDSDITASFLKAVKSYEDGNVAEAAEDFRRLHEAKGPFKITANLVAALLRTGERGKARSVAKRLVSFLHRLPWQLIYNYALALDQKDCSKAVRLLERHLRDTSRGLTLMAALCRAGIDNVSLRAKLSPALDRLRESTVQPSLELLLALAWAQLIGPNPNKEKCRSYLKEVLDRTRLQALIPPAEVNAMQQVRAAYQQLKQGGKGEDAVQYLSRIVEAKETERSEQPSRNIDKNIGVELVAREFLVTEYSSQGKRLEALQMLDACETLLLAHAEAISPGFLAKDWQEISKLSLDLGLPFAALRRADCGLKIDSESSDLKSQRLHIESQMVPEETLLLDANMSRLAALCCASSAPLSNVSALASALESSDLLKLRAPATFKALASLLTIIQSPGDGDFETEEKADHVAVLGRAELPQAAEAHLTEILSWVVKSFAKEQPRNPLDVEIYDDRLWPRSYESQACSLLVLNSVGQEGCAAGLYERASGKCLWQGPIRHGSPMYVRWTIEREDGFIADEQVDIPLLVRVSSPVGFPEYTLTVNASVASSDAVWPDYPTGALDPKDVQGGELYGRGAFIKKIVNSLGQSRTQATYLIEGVRQMGKTSLLKFIKQHAPKHVLPIYVNLEAIQSDPERNVWNIIIEQVLRDEEAARHVPLPDGQIEGQRHGDLVALAKRLCAASGKSYLLLLLDELHVLLRESKNPKGVLADFRTDLNEVSNKISLLLADRYTLGESEKKIDSEYWLQLTPQSLDPLDVASTRSAIDVPCQGTDIRFLPDAIERVYFWTCGYPFHVQRLVQNVLANNLEGPWVTVMPGDVDVAIPGLLDQDRLFQEGLCRKDRLDAELQAAIAAVLEWSDVRELLPALSEEPDWSELLKHWEPQLAELIAGLGDPDEILNRLVAVGVMRRDSGRVKFFSPLLERWLHKMRNENRSLLIDRGTGNWGLSPDEEVALLAGTEWMRFDAELSSRCQKAGVPPPLKLKAAHPESWATLTRSVTSGDDFQLFLNTTHDLLIDGREEKQAMLKYPWLMLAYHRLRLVRNVFIHGAKPSMVALSAWDKVYFRGVGRQRNGGEPNGSEEWRSVQLVLLRAFHIGYRNAIAIAGESTRRAAARR